MGIKSLIIAVLYLILTVGVMAAIPPDDTATCAVSVTVDNIMEWSANFPAIPLATMTTQSAAPTGTQSITPDNIMEWSADFPAIPLATMTTQAAAPTGTKSITLYTYGNANITADNTNASQLTKTTDTLVTSYSLTYDGDGVTATGGSSVGYTVYSSFLTTASVIKHIPLDGAVVVTLSVKAENDAGNVADAGDYKATQTLTASWGSQ
jgi:hypothetical protein